MTYPSEESAKLSFWKRTQMEFKSNSIQLQDFATNILAFCFFFQHRNAALVLSTPLHIHTLGHDSAHFGGLNKKAIGCEIMRKRRKKEKNRHGLKLRRMGGNGGEERGDGA
ncbi:hypothetical protein B9Z55_019615 [Caenorhabditis nigoni]|uniref:Uncharacterized protein n=1 Tax=Caenorhabditis nigoni TaxID=1611254 RepID=A0A2G5TJ81_9PELO|nr:hypothetical protein B9Z55_019615 [Caenorhabditis nigoni]